MLLAASSGVPKTGRRAASSVRRASTAVALSPTQPATSGTRRLVRIVSLTARAASTLEATAVGQLSARIASARPPARPPRGGRL